MKIRVSNIRISSRFKNFFDFCFSVLLLRYFVIAPYILSELSEAKHVGAVLIDLKKAFDTVDHQILLKKLFCYGFRDMSFGWFQSYLSNLMQCTLFNEVTSDLTREHPFGVPQDSVLGPLLFLIYINDVEQTIDSDPTFLILYADDKILIQSSKDPNLLTNNLNIQLTRIIEWFIKK